MENRRIDDLLAYLDRLAKLQSINVRCHKEIDECISAIRVELKLTSCEACKGLGYVTAISDAIRHTPCESCGGKGR